MPEDPNRGHARAALLSAVDAALARMGSRWGTENEHYRRLLLKRDEVASGAEYSCENAAPPLIAAAAGRIGELTRATGLRRPLRQRSGTP